MNMKRRIKLTESELHRFVSECVKRALKEEEIEPVEQEKWKATEDDWQGCAVLAQQAMKDLNFEEAIRLCDKASQLYDEDVEANVPSGQLPSAEKKHGWFRPDIKNRRVRPTTNGSGRYKIGKKKTYSPMDDFLKDPKYNWPVN